MAIQLHRLRVGSFVRVTNGLGNQHPIGVVCEINREVGYFKVMTLDSFECFWNWFKFPKQIFLERVFSRREIRAFVEKHQKQYDDSTGLILPHAEERVREREKVKARRQELLAQFL